MGVCGRAPGAIGCCNDGRDDRRRCSVRHPARTPVGVPPLECNDGGVERISLPRARSCLLSLPREVQAGPDGFLPVGRASVQRFVAGCCLRSSLGPCSAAPSRAPGRLCHPRSVRRSVAGSCVWRGLPAPAPELSPHRHPARSGSGVPAPARVSAEKRRRR